jgi:hypothetical protein
MKLHYYCVDPIDFWIGALTGKQLLETIWKGNPSDWHNISCVCKKIDDLEANAKEAFRSMGWEGDVREGPFYFALPGHNEMLIGYIIKQDNNGDTYIASPVPLPYLGN